MKLCSLSVACCAFVCSQATLASHPLPVPADSVLKAEGRVAFTEGPAWHPSGNVYFSDIANSRIMRRDRTGQLHVFRIPSGRTNGLLFDHEGRLLCCEGGSGCRLDTEPDVELVESFLETVTNHDACATDC